MHDPLDLPPDLRHLLEKRSQPDRRETTRRKADDDPVPTEDGIPEDADSRSNSERRQQARRDSEKG